MNYGKWQRSGSDYGAIVSDQPTGHDGPSTVEAYGGYLVCESVPKKVEGLLLAAPKLLDACEQVLVYLNHSEGQAPNGLRLSSAMGLLREAILSVKEQQ